MSDDFDTVRIELTAVFEYDAANFENLTTAQAEAMAIDALLANDELLTSTIRTDPIGPINGSITKTTWVDEGSMLAYVEKDGETFRETYTHNSTERVE